MIEAIKRIGNYILEKEGEQKFLENICIKISPKLRKNNKEYNQYVVILNFDTNGEKISCDIEAIREDSEKKYLWIGNNPGNKKQIFFTTNNATYLFTQSIPNIKVKVEGSLKNDIEQILNKFFIKGNGGYLINPEKFEFFNEKINSITNELNNVESSVQSITNKKDINEIIKKFENTICKELNIKCEISVSMVK